MRSFPWGWHDREKPEGGTGNRPTSRQDRAFLVLQLLGTIVALGWVPGNLAKLATLLIVWVIGFRRLSRADLALMAIVDAVFIAADSGALHHQVFRFCHPDLIGMPVYEFFMWGFYALHTIRSIGGRYPPRGLLPTLLLAVLFAATFSLIREADLLLVASATVLALAMLVCHDRDDFLYAGYMVAIGVLIEYVGTGTGQWVYPGSPLGGVPAWFVTMWGGVGLFVRRLLLPLHGRLDRRKTFFGSG